MQKEGDESYGLARRGTTLLEMWVGMQGELLVAGHGSRL